MKGLKIDNPVGRAALRYLIEAILIIGSILIAFFLENQRLRDFERDNLIGKIEKLKQVLIFDSLKYHDMYEDIDGEQERGKQVLWSNPIRFG